MNADILILGAGIAGLRCGIEILKKRPSLTIVILEKYNYTGGRVVTYHKKIEDIQGNCSSVQWENGAGRVSLHHRKILQLFKQYKIATIPMNDTVLYEEDGVMTQNIFTDTMRLLSSAFESLSEDYLATHTVREALTVILGEEKTDRFLLQFPYRSEVDTLRADLGIETFKEEMGSYKGFVGVKEGLSTLVQSMAKDFTGRGGTILHDQEVVHIEKAGSMILVRTKESLWEAPTVISALHRDAYKTISFFNEWETLQYLKMEPLLRAYAVFPTKNGKSWFSGSPKVVSSSPLRFFIPIDPSCGTVMISYTDGNDARELLQMIKQEGEEKTGDFIVEQARRVFPEKEIPDPLFFKFHPWTSGCTYWLPGNYDPTKESRRALKPFSDINLYCCGESFSTKQAWMEGAVEHADLLLDTYF